MSDARLVACTILSAAGFIGAAIASLGGPNSQAFVFIGAVLSILFLIPAARRIIGSFDGKHLKAFITGQPIE